MVIIYDINTNLLKYCSFVERSTNFHHTYPGLVCYLILVLETVTEYIETTPKIG